MSAEQRSVYLDSSAIVKLAAAEPESAALRRRRGAAGGFRLCRATAEATPGRVDGSGPPTAEVAAPGWLTQTCARGSGEGGAERHRDASGIQRLRVSLDVASDDGLPFSV
jgi:hypothetical protein